MEIINVCQREPEWYQARLGIPTSSNFDKIITTTGKSSTQRKKYLYKLAGEKVAGVAEETYQNGAMLRGIELEDEARQTYQFITDNDVQEVGFCLSEGYGCSPDGLIGDNGGIEIKCPSIAVHVEYLLNNSLPSTYFQQVQGSLLVTGREWWDFVSFYPSLRPLIIRVKRDEKFIAELKMELKIFCDELNETINKIK